MHWIAPTGKDNFAQGKRIRAAVDHHRANSGLKSHGFHSSIFDHCCRSGPAFAGFVQSDKFVKQHGGRVGDIAAYEQANSVRRQHGFGLPQEALRVNTTAY
jgi:hypothetical protein